METVDGARLHAPLSLPFSDALVRVKEAFKAEGFGALSEMDVRKALQEKLGEKIEPYTILGMCNPQLAARAIAAEHEIGLFLPCNVLLHACGGMVNVTAQDPIQLMQMTHNAALQPIAEEARLRIARAIASLSE